MPYYAKDIVVDPGAGYRILDDGEVIESGDEYRDGDGCWSKTGDAGVIVGLKGRNAALTYRRKIEFSEEFTAAAEAYYRSRHG